MSESRRQKRQMLDRIKLERGCIFCGYNRHPKGLVFHHRNPKKKKFKISQSMGRSPENLLKETEKCVVMCQNCHAVYHDLAE